MGSKSRVPAKKEAGVQLQKPPLRGCQYPEIFKRFKRDYLLPKQQPDHVPQQFNRRIDDWLDYVAGEIRHQFG